MKQGIFEIIENTALTESVFRMRLLGDTSAITAAGQFVNIQLAARTRCSRYNTFYRAPRHSFYCPR